MDSRRFILAVVLMITVVVLTNVLFPPVSRGPATPPADSATAAQPAAQSGQTATPVQPPALQPTAGAPLTPAAQARIDTVIVESPIYRYAFTSNGGALVSAELLRYESFTRGAGRPVQLAPRTPRGLVSQRLQAGERVIDLSTLPFTASAQRLDLVDSATRTLRLTHSSAELGTIEIEYEFRPDDYVVGVRTSVRDARVPTTRLLIDLGPTLAINEARAAEDERALAYVVNDVDEGVRSVPLRNVDERRVESGPLEWVALKNKYFVVAAIVAERDTAPRFGGVIADDVPERYAANLTATLAIGADQQSAYRLYLGPQEYDRLLALGHKLHEVNPYGWRVFRPIIRPVGAAITWALLAMHRALSLSYGWVLILFGILIRLALWPLNAKAMRSQLKNMELQPRLKELQTRYKNEPDKLQKEMLRLYREEGFNPMGGCLPMLIPFPVLITLFFVFQSTIEFRGVEFLWLPDLSRPDPYYILPIVLGATMFVQQWLSMKTAPPNPQLKFMMWFMPLFMVVIFFNLASGLNLYYAAQNLPGFVQQMQLSKERERYQRERGLTRAPAAPTPAPKPAPRDAGAGRSRKARGKR